MVGPSSHNHKQEMPLEIFEGDKSLEKGNDIDQITEELHESFPSSIEKVPQTPELESSSSRLNDDLESVVSCEEDLVEARITWDIGKTLGCKVSNEKAMICALAKLPEYQDFVLPRKRSRPRKNKCRSKD